MGIKFLSSFAEINNRDIDYDCRVKRLTKKSASLE